MEKNVEAYIVADSNTCTQIIDPLSVFADALSSHLKHCVDALYRMGISLILWSRCTNSFNWTNRQQTNKQTNMHKQIHDSTFGMNATFVFDLFLRQQLLCLALTLSLPFANVHLWMFVCLVHVLDIDGYMDTFVHTNQSTIHTNTHTPCIEFSYTNSLWNQQLNKYKHNML